MKTKDIPIWERYLEYIVLLIAVLVFVGFSVMQFIGNPNAVSKDGREIAPGEVDDLLREEAERLNTMLVQDAPSPITIETPEPMSDVFGSKLNEAISPIDSLVAYSPSWPLPGPGGTTLEGGGRYAEPNLPAPHTVVAQQFFDGLLPEVVGDFPALPQLVGDPPYDVTWVTPVAIFELDGVLDAFRRENPDQETLAIPEAWYRGRVTVLDVEVERQERVDGVWGEPMTLTPIPGQLSLRTQLAGKVDAMLRDEILSSLGQPGSQEQIVQPPFYETRLAAWAPPDPRLVAAMGAADADDPASEQLKKLRFQRERVVRQRQNVQKWVDDNCDGVGGGGAGAGGGAAGGGRQGGGGAGGGRGRGAPGGGGFGAGAGQGRRRGAGDGGLDAQAKEARCKAKQSQLDRFGEQLSRIDDQIRAFVGEDAPAEEEVAPNLMEANELLVWAHDLEVEVGKVYRYRFTVDVYNPFFAQKIQLVAEQQQLAESVALGTERSDWSTPIEIAPPLKFFITDARPASDGGPRGLSMGHANVELFRFYDGQWWGEEARFMPGQRLDASTTEEREGQQVTVEFGTEWFVLDIIAVPDRQPGERFSGQVLLQNLRTGEITTYRDPESEARDPELQKLRQEIELAKVEVASAS